MSGWGGVLLGVIGFIVVATIGVAVCVAVLFQVCKFIFFHYRIFLFVGVALVYLQGFIKNGYPESNLIVIWMVVAVGYIVVSFLIRDYQRVKYDATY